MADTGAQRCHMQRSIAAWLLSPKMSSRLAKPKDLQAIDTPRANGNFGEHTVRSSTVVFWEKMQ